MTTDSSILLVLGLLVLPGASAQTGAPPPKGRIEGSVVDASTGAPVRKATVTLFHPGGFRTSVVTDREGAFRVDGLEFGTYRCSIYAALYVRAEPESPALRYHDMALAITASEPVLKVRLPMLRAALVEGVFVDEDGDPIPSPTAGLLRANPAGANPEVPLTFSPWGGPIDDFGEFRFPLVEPGTYVLKAGNCYYPNAHRPADAVRLEVAAGQEITGLRVSCAPLPGVKVRGRLRDTGPKGSEPLSVQLMEDPISDRAYRAALAPDGRFEIPSVPPGRYDVYVRLSRQSYQMCQSGIEVRSGEQEPLDVSCPPRPTHAIRGTVLIDGHPAANLGVEARSVGAGLIYSVPFTQTDGSGKFAFPEVPQGEYRLSILAGGSKLHVVSVQQGAQAAPGDTISFSASAEIQVNATAQGCTILASLSSPKDAKNCVLITVVPDAPRFANLNRQVLFALPEPDGSPVPLPCFPGTQLALAVPDDVRLVDELRRSPALLKLLGSDVVEVAATPGGEHRIKLNPIPSKAIEAARAQLGR